MMDKQEIVITGQKHRITENQRDGYQKYMYNPHGSP